MDAGGLIRPTDYNFDAVTGELVVTSSQNAHVYIVDMKTGGIERDYTIAGAAFSDSYMSSPIAFDKSLNYNVDSIYIGSTYNNNESGAIFKITVPQNDTTFNSIAEDSDYNDDPSTWADISLLSLTPAPVTSPFSVSIDVFDNVWVYGGTGRYMDQPDKTSTLQNYFFGIKDPFFNKNMKITDIWNMQRFLSLLLRLAGKTVFSMQTRTWYIKAALLPAEATSAPLHSF